MMPLFSRLQTYALRLTPIIVLLGAWQVLTWGSPRRAFFLGSPALFAEELFRVLRDGSLLYDMLVTGVEAASGFLLGNVTGVILGLLLWQLPALFRALRPYVLALGYAPLFAFAPLIVLWFGTGLFAKVIVAALSTVFLALMQAYKGAQEAEGNLIQLIQSFGGDRWTVFRKVIVPSSTVWVVNAFRLNIGFALLGAFLAEYISSTHGLGHLILVAGGLYNIPLVLVGVVAIVSLGALLSLLVSALERPVTRLLVKL